MRNGLVVAMLLGAVSVAAAQVPGAPLPGAEVVARLGELAGAGAGEWRFQHPAQPGGELPATDDSGWPRVRPEHSWEGANTAAWYRRLVTVPEQIGGVSPAGSRLTLRCAVDDDLEVFVNGALRGRFHWDQGQVVLTERAAAGETFLIAIRALNQGGPGRLLSAELGYERFEQVREPAEEARRRLAFAQRLLASPGLPNRAELEAALSAAAAKVDFAALSRGDREAFETSLTASGEALKPFSPVVSQYALYLAGHAHIDMNWLWLWPETKEVCRLTWTQALKFMEQWPEFRFGQSQPAAYLAIEQDQPELFKGIEAAVRAGQWEPLGAGWVENDMNMVSGEALARQCLLTESYYREHFGVHSETAWCPDTFGHAWTVPSILSDAGLKYYYFCRCGKGYPLFRWEGPDGARLLAYNFAGWYGEQMRPDKGELPLRMKEQVGLPAAMLVYGVGDHGGGPTRTDVDWAHKLQHDPVFPQVRFAKTSDFFAAADTAPGTHYPVVRDELNFTFEGCYTTHADIKRWNREGESLLPTAETLATIAAGLGQAYPAEKLTAAWQDVCFNQFHDIFDGSAIHGSYDYSRERHEQAVRAATETIRSSLQTLGAQVDSRGSGQALLLYNPVAWDRTDYVEVTLRTPERVRAARLVSEHGGEVPVQVIDSRAVGEACETTYGFVAALPATGYAVYHLQGLEQREGAAGRPARPRDTDTEGTGTPPPGALPLTIERCLAGAQLQVLTEAPGGMSAWTIGRLTGTETLQPLDEGRIRLGAVCTRYTRRYRYGASTMGLLIRTYPELPRVDFELDVDWQEVGNAQVGGKLLKAAFATGARQPRATYSVPWGSIERAVNGREVPGQQWVDLAETEPVRTGPGTRPHAIDLGAYYDLDAVATLDKPRDGDFDRGERAYPASIFGEKPGAELVVEGIPFRTPPLGEGALNAVQARGQTIEWTPESTSALAVLGASSNGAHGGSARLLYTDGSEQAVPLQFSDWCYGPAGGELDALQAGYRLGTGGRMEPPVHLWLRTLTADRRKHLRGLVLPDSPNLKVFGLAFANEVARRDVWGVSLLNDSKYGFDASGDTLRMSLLRCSWDPDPRPDQGRHRIRYALLPHRGDWRQAQTPRRAYEFNTPILVVPVQSHAGPLPPARSYLKVEPANMMVTALKRAEDGSGAIVRVVNSTGVGGVATLSGALGFGAATECNLLEQARATNGAQVRDGVVRVDLGGRLHDTVRVK